MKKVLYFIQEYGHPGGHMFSLEHTVKALSKVLQPGVFVLGKPFDGTSKLDCYLGSAPIACKSYDKVKKCIERFSPDIIHCFDIGSYVFVSLFFSRKAKIIFTKCGGSNPKTGWMIPYAPNVILYSEENMEYFTRKYPCIKFFLLPNRVYVDSLSERPAYSYPKECAINVCQIIRLSESKEKSIFSSLQLISELRCQGVDVHFTLVGTINSKESYKKVLNVISEHNISACVTLITDERTNHGSSFLEGADFVIATGRSLMEACSLGKAVLSPVEDLGIPVLLRSENFQKLYDTNFSGRGRAVSTNEVELEIIVKAMTDSQYKENISTFNKNQAEKYFLITDRVIEKYKKIYSCLKPVSRLLMLLRNSYIYLYYILVIWRKKRP